MCMDYGHVQANKKKIQTLDYKNFVVELKKKQKSTVNSDSADVNKSIVDSNRYTLFKK